jgi:protein tyrosine phosphatase (PTP) superfamily phosphohydrolase (DUF442 family)
MTKFRLRCSKPVSSFEGIHQRSAQRAGLTRRIAVGSAFAALFAAGLPRMSHGRAATHDAAAQRPAEWAMPVVLEGVPNLHRINPGLYRSAQPKSEGFALLARRLGVRTVVNLRALHSDEALAEGAGLTLLKVPIHTWHIREARIIEALHHLSRATAANPVLVHCNHGADRTGLIVALYRTLYDGWQKNAAIDEMLRGEFGFHAVWGNIPAFIGSIHVGRLRQMIESS